MRFVFACLLILGLLCIAAIGAVWLAIDDKPAIQVVATKQLDEADAVDSLLKQIKAISANRKQASQLEISERQMQSLQGFVNRAELNITGDAKLEPNKGTVRATFEFTAFGSKKYINSQIWFSQGSGIPVDKIKVGSITLPGWLALSMFEHTANLMTHSRSGSELINSVNSIAVEDGLARVSLNPLDSLLDELRRIDRGVATQKDLFIEQQTAAYLRALEDYERKNGIRPRSLGDYIQVVFSLAQQESTADTAVPNNEAAILSLAIYAGHYRIGTFVGDVQKDVENPSAPNHMPVLANRGDLSQHFIISAALNILSQRGFSLAVGEFKELMDRARGGSGYSFVDLAADRAGVKFAVLATDPTKARLIQQRLAQGVDESLFFPAITGLAEGLSKNAFVNQYGGVDSDKYTSEVNRIKARIEALPLYQ